MEVEPRDGEEDPAEAIPFVTMEGFRRESRGRILAALRRAVQLWSLFTGALRGCVFGGLKLGSRVRSDGASYCAWVLSSRIISVSMVRTGFFLLSGPTAKSYLP